MAASRPTAIVTQLGRTDIVIHGTLAGFSKTRHVRSDLHRAFLDRCSKVVQLPLALLASRLCPCVPEVRLAWLIISLSLNPLMTSMSTNEGQDASSARPVLLLCQFGPGIHRHRCPSSHRRCGVAAWASRCSDHFHFLCSSFV